MPSLVLQFGKPVLRKGQRNYCLLLANSQKIIWRYPCLPSASWFDDLPGNEQYWNKPKAKIKKFREVVILTVNIGRWEQAKLFMNDSILSRCFPETRSYSKDDLLNFINRYKTVFIKPDLSG
ncbi:lysine 2,3-aminomutase YodO family protein [Neobacillus bataviensis LMG 21833]|uniref:Lysine 2,3-aminomutase YodO family protein n=1 Tax=Neobacillus bataviensis LMG 21833 TaxID=1117379 RepID=K6DR62_9BACI|nr:lysine 2,3-aminomutase YodO family protein [Neobacillus bataviensis LMG 21833]